MDDSKKLRLAACVLASALVQPSHAAEPACAKPEHRQFDFWLGDWDVRDAKGDPAGKNVITSVLGGCVVHESWQGRGGMKGESFNAYDAARSLWHQTWVDDRGGLLVLEGRFTDGRMVLVGRKGQGEKGESQERITWEKKPDGRVRQLWESSTDEGKTWKVLFDGTYVRVAGSS